MRSVVSRVPSELGSLHACKPEFVSDSESRGSEDVTVFFSKLTITPVVKPLCVHLKNH